MVRLNHVRRGSVWHVDFRVNGVRYRMSTGETDRTAAEAVGRARLENVMDAASGRRTDLYKRLSDRSRSDK